jgi:predicted enzyme related to lactoylglutathione lyase
MNQTQTRPVVTGIDMAACLVSDPERAIAFYRDVLGLTPTQCDRQGRGAEFTLPDGSTFGVWNNGDGKISGAAFFFAVDDARSAVDEFRSRGARISYVNETAVCLMAFGQDPDGNGFIIHQRKIR